MPRVCIDTEGDTDIPSRNGMFKRKSKLSENSKFDLDASENRPKVLSVRSASLSRRSSQEEKEAEKVRAKTNSKVLTKRPLIISRKEYENIRNNSQYVSKEERQAALLAAAKERERLLKESMERKEAIRKMDMMRSHEKGKILNEIEEEAERRTMHVLERAQNLKLEQEEEIQKCNKIILEAKCRAVRDAQIAEKRLIERELAEEDKRLNDMMENERRWAIKEELKKEREETAKKQEFAKILKNQIKENEAQQILEFERKQEESYLINISNIAWQEREIEKLQRKEIESIQIRQDLKEANEQLRHFKAMDKEENRIMDLRIREYQRLQNERNAQLAEERRLEKSRKESDKERLATQAKHTQDLRMNIDEINAERIQEEVEREWRRKEKEEVLRKMETVANLRKEREEQIKNKRIMQAIEIERDRREFERILHVQKATFCREKREREKKQQEALIHRSEILKQVNEKEKERIQTRQNMFEEGLIIRTEAALRKKKLYDAMERKCNEMRENKVPEIYVNDVKRMIENIQ